jgi:hypothetical protein
MADRRGWFPPQRIADESLEDYRRDLRRVMKRWQDRADRETNRHDREVYRHRADECRKLLEGENE